MFPYYCNFIKLNHLTRAQYLLQLLPRKAWRWIRCHHDAGSFKPGVCCRALGLQGDSTYTTLVAGRGPPRFTKHRTWENSFTKARPADGSEPQPKEDLQSRKLARPCVLPWNAVSPCQTLQGSCSQELSQSPCTSFSRATASSLLLASTRLFLAR